MRPDARARLAAAGRQTRPNRSAPWSCTVPLRRSAARPRLRFRRAQARRAEHERRGRNATGLDRLRHLLTIPAA